MANPGRPLWRHLIAAALALSVLSACSSPYSPATHVAGCPSGTSVTVSEGLAPRFTWGGCDVAVLSVQPVDADGQFTGPTVWHVNGEETSDGVLNNVIESGVRYGIEPRLATTVREPAPLQSGQRYRVLIGVTGPIQRFLFGEVGAAFFTP